MAVTCEQVAAILEAGGRAALSDQPEAQDHIGECEACADRFIALEEMAPPEPPAVSPFDVEPPVSPQVPEVPLQVPEVPLQVPEVSLQVPEIPLQVPEIPLQVPEIPLQVPEAAPPVPQAPPSVLEISEVSPTAPAFSPFDPPTADSAPIDDAAWLPSGMPPAPRVTAIFESVGEPFVIRPVHLLLVGVGSALLGSLITLLIAGSLRPTQEATSEPSTVAAREELGADSIDLAMGDLVPVFSGGETGEEGGEEAVDNESGAPTGGSKRKTGHKGKHKGRGAVSSAAGAAVSSATGVSRGAGDKPLTTAEISAGIKKNLSKLGACFVAARKRKEVEAGKHTLILDFLILPDGTVRDAALMGPVELANKRLGKCVATKVRQWRFPASTNGSPVRKLQLPINVK